ncbi:MAG: hypothetical protein WCE69_17405 [Aestuariivirga sp.]
MNLQSVIDQIAAAAGLDGPTAERAAGIILSVIQQEVDPAVAAQVFGKLPGATELAAANLVSASSGGMLSSLANSVLGSKAGVLAAGFTALEATGLTVAQIEQAGLKLMAYVKANAGSGLSAQVIAALPGLAGKKA